MLPLHYYPSYVWSIISKPFFSSKKKALNQKLFWSIRNKKYDEMKEAIFQGANINTVFHIALPFRESALTMVAVWGDLSLIQFLVDRGADINFNNGAILEHCMQLGQPDIAHYLIEEGANITYQRGRLIEWLVKCKQFETLKLLLDNPKQRQYVLGKITNKIVSEWADHYVNAGHLYESLNTKLQAPVQKTKSVKI